MEPWQASTLMFIPTCGTGRAASVIWHDWMKRFPTRPARTIQHVFSAWAQQQGTMHHALALLLAVSAVAAIATGSVGTLAEETEGPSPKTHPVARIENCLSPADMRESVAEKRVVPPLTAIRAARSVYPRAEIQRATLCKQEAGLVYVLTALRRDGQFVQVMVDAQSGQVHGQ